MIADDGVSRYNLPSKVTIRDNEEIMMELVFKVLLSPMAFGVGFIWPLTTQSVIALHWLPAGSAAILAGAIVGFVVGLMAQFRGSWIWVK